MNLRPRPGIPSVSFALLALTLTACNRSSTTATLQAGADDRAADDSLQQVATSTTADTSPTTGADDQRMNWWREARFGMFIHWGLYSIPAGKWGDQTNHAEWIMTTARIPIERYERFLDQFNPVKFDADRWARMAKDAGMRYVVITSKHHDGFCLFDSGYTDYDVMSTPFQRDILKELSEACARQGLKMCWYHSIMDWHHPDYLPRRPWDRRPTVGADYDRYVRHMKNQLKELLTNYGKIGVLWFDGEWEDTWTHERGRDLYRYVRSLQPSIIINNRVDKGREGMQGLTRRGNFVGDFGTPEQEIPATGLPNTDWETCMTMNNHWGYNAYDKNWKSSADLIRKLSDIASKGGNFLLNIGPKSDGTFPRESIERLRDIGRWMKLNGESIHGTTASPFVEQLPWGRCTTKALSGERTRLYLHVFDWPRDGRLELVGLRNKPLNAFLLSDAQRPNIAYSHHDKTITFQLPAEPPNPVDSVIALDIQGKPDTVRPLKVDITPDPNAIPPAATVTLTGAPRGAEIRFTLDGSDPTPTSALYQGPFKLTRSATVQAQAFKDGKIESLVGSARRLINAATGKPVVYKTAYSAKYPAAGDQTLTDGHTGSTHYDDGRWQGLQGDDVDVTIDLGRAMPIGGVYVRFLQAQKSWIFLPTEVRFSVSTDGRNYEPVQTVENTISEKENGVFTHEFAASFAGRTARYLHVQAVNRGVCPQWHPGAGGKAWLFTDEVIVTPNPR